MVLHIRMLGDFSLVCDGRGITSLNTPRLQSLFVYLVLHSSAPQMRSQIAFQFWPDSSESQAHTNLRKLVYTLRSSLPDSERYLRIDNDSLQLRPEAPLIVDVGDFENALALASAARKADDSGAEQEALENAIRLYRGSLLPGCYEDWIMPDRERLRQACTRALQRLVELLENRCSYSDAIRYAGLLLEFDSLQEESYRLLMRLHALNGDRLAALQAYRRCAALLQQELAVEPSRETRQLYERIMKLDLARKSEPDASHSLHTPLIGRQVEWQQLRSAWRTAASGEPHMVVVSGEAGIGKSRLLEELMEWTRRQGIAAASAACYPMQEGLAYTPVTTWLRTLPIDGLEDIWLVEVSRILPELLPQGMKAGIQNPDQQNWNRQRLFEGLARAILSRGQPLLLVLENIQWCDQDTIEWLNFLLHFDPRLRVLVVASLRPAEISDHHPVNRLMISLQHESQLQVIDLCPLTESDTGSLAVSLIGKTQKPVWLPKLFQLTEGNPLFIVETLRAGAAAEKGVAFTPSPRIDFELQVAPPRVVDSGSIPLPVTIHALIKDRLAHLSPDAIDLLEMAAVIGREFSYDHLCQVSGWEEQRLVQVIDELSRRGILREHGHETYEFSHAMIRMVVINSLSTAHHRLLQRRLTRTLEAFHTPEIDPVSMSGCLFPGYAR